MKRFKLLTAIGLVFVLILTGCSKKTETTENPLENDLEKIINAYFVALKETDQIKLSRVVSWETYKEYTSFKQRQQNNALGNIISWKIDSSQTYINTDANQALYYVNVQTTKQTLTMNLDIRPYFNQGWRVFGVKIVKTKLNKAPKGHSTNDSPKK